MQDMSTRHFGFSMLLIGAIGVYLLFSVENTIQTRSQNDININNASNCIELSAYYSQAVSFENGFKDHGFADHVTQEEKTKAKELNCN